MFCIPLLLFLSCLKNRTLYCWCSLFAGTIVLIVAYGVYQPILLDIMTLGTYFLVSKGPGLNHPWIVFFSGLGFLLIWYDIILALLLYMDFVCFF